MLKRITKTVLVAMLSVAITVTMMPFNGLSFAKESGNEPPQTVQEMADENGTQGPEQNVGENDLTETEQGGNLDEDNEELNKDEVQKAEEQNAEEQKAEAQKAEKENAEGRKVENQKTEVNQGPVVEEDLPDAKNASDEEIVDHDVVINIEAFKDDDDQPIVKAETGESLGVNFYAYNDNPNSTAIAKIRVYIDQTTKDDNVKKVEVKEESRKDIKLSILEGGKATEVNAKWGTDAEREMDYMEFELPAGASVSVDLPYSVETGYDDNVEARIFSEYMVADRNGNYPNDWTETPSEVLLSWTGSFAWDNFIKSASVKKISYSELIDGYFDPQKLTYTFGATNLKLGEQTGVIYTRDMTLADTMTLPEGISLPDGAVVAGDNTKIVDGDGNAVYEVKAANGEVKELKIISNQKVSYKAVVENPDPENASWNPYADLSVVLHLNNLKKSASADLEEKKITNIADTEIKSVNDKIESYKGEGPAESVFKPAGDFELKKTITGVKDKEGEPVSQVVNPDTKLPEWQVGKKYVVSYKLTLTNSGTSAFQVKNLKDVLPAGLILDESSLKVTIEDGDEVSNYQKNITTDSDGNTTMVLSGFSVPAAKSAEVTYNATVTDDDELFQSGVELTNVATLGNIETESKVRMVGNPKLVLKKAVIARYTKDPSGYDIVILGTYDWENEKYTNIEIRGNLNALGYSSQPNLATKEKLLHEFYAGDVVLYEISVENKGDGDYTGTVSDRDPFQSYENGYYSNTRHYYYATGETYYQSNINSYSYNYSVHTDYGTVFRNANSVNTEPGNTSYNYGKKELKDRATVSSYGALYGPTMGGIQWKFNGTGENDKIKAGENLHQTTLVQIPGSATADITRTAPSSSSSSNISNNYYFEELATAYAYTYTSNNWNKKDTLTNAVYATPVTGNSLLKSNDLFHTVKGQISIDTGVISKGFAEDANNVKGSDFKTYYSGPEGWKNQPGSDLTYFEAKNNQVFVNYVYVYNDSSEPLDFNRKQLNVYIPQEFDWLGFVQAGWGSSGDSNGSYLSMTNVNSYDYNGQYNTSMNAVRMSGEYYNAGSQLVAMNYRNYSPSISSSPGPSALDYYYDPEHVKNYNYIYGQNNGSTSINYTNYKRVQVTSSSTVVEPYTGFLFYYAVKVSDPTTAANHYKYNTANFFADVRTTDSTYINNYSPITDVREYYDSSRVNLRQGLSNRGENASLLHSSFGSSASNALQGGIFSLARNPYAVAAGVGLTLKDKHYYRMAVEKEVVKNDGEDSVDQYRTGNQYKSDIELDTKYDDYEWGYPLHDGVHRTVDGTVTWKTTVKNTGTDAGMHDGINYSMLIDTIDSPYELAEIYIPTLIYNMTSMNGKQTYENFRAKLPLGTEGWTNMSSGVDVIQFDMNGQPTTNTQATSVDVSTPRIRVTRKLVSGGSIATGYDVTAEAGDKNVDAYRYIIEIAGTYSNSTLYYPLLDLGESVDFYLTFATTDAIETNYNSFAAAFPMLGENDNLIVTNNAKTTTVSGTHNGQGSVARSRSALRSTGPTNIQDYNGPYYPSGSNSQYAQEPASAQAVEYSDWTDTSYTDALKTMTLYDEEGDVAEKIDSRSDGNMVLSRKAKPGDKMHIKLNMESVLYESENYTFFDDLVIYDLYGTSEKFSYSSERNLCGYDVDFSTIKLTDSLEREYVLGTDYDIYYTKSNLVYTEHHPISPVNTLKYAADYGMLEASSVTWTKYNAGDEVTIDDAHAFKIVLKNGKDKVYNHKTTDAGGEWAGFTLYVDYDAYVPADIDTSSYNTKSYPNVEAYTANMHVKDSPEIKPFREDTTAIMYQTTSDSSITIKKTTVNMEAQEQIEDPDSEFLFMIIRKLPGKTGLNDPENVDAAITFTLKDGEVLDLQKDANINIVYSAKDDNDQPVVSSAREFFITPTQQNYYLIELDAGKYTTDAYTIAKSYSMNRSIIETTFGMGDLQTTDESVNAILQNLQGKKVKGVLFSKHSANAQGGYTLEVECSNVYSKRDIQITKTDEDGNTIYKEVTFQLLDSEGNPLTFEEDPNGFRYSSEGDITDLTFEGMTTLFGVDPGEYILQETKAPEGYVIDPETEGKTEISLNSTKNPSDRLYKVSVANKSGEDSTKGSIKLYKIDSGTEEVIKDDKAVFQIYASREEGAEPLTFVKSTADGKTYYEYAETGDELYSELETTEGVMDIRDLPIGTYYLVEKKAPAGYELAGNTLETALEVKIERRLNVTEIRLPNKWISGRAAVKKIDSITKKPILDTSAEFNLIDSEGNTVKFEELAAGSYTYNTEGEVTALLTDPVTGLLSLSALPEGDYVLKEMKAPVGYTIDKAETDIAITDNELVEASVENTPAEISLELIKKWRLEGGKKTYPLKGVPFTLYKTNEDGTKAKKFKEGATDARGVIDFGEIDWHRVYYLYEEVPEGYSGSATDTVFLDGEGSIDLTAEDGTPIEVIKLDLSNKAAKFIEKGEELVYEANVLNIKNVTYGGLYASVSYKTIDNKKAAAEYEGLKERTGYGFYYTDADYAAGNYNYVDAVNPGDIVTYTLNVSNVSDYDFGSFTIIDRLPEKDDTGVVNLKEKRDSEFTVSNRDGEFTVSVDGETVDPEMYEVTFSDKTEFTNGDFNGTTTWDGAYETAKSIRIAFGEDFRLEPGQKVTVTFDGKISDTAKPGEFAWNDFAYRYTAITEDDASSKGLFKFLVPNTTDEDVVVDRAAKANGAARGVVITPEPPKVGVRIIDCTTVIEGSKTFEANKKAKAAEDTFTFKLTRTDDLDYEVTYETKDGELAPLTDEGLTVDVEAKINGGKVKFEFPRLHFSHTGKYSFKVVETPGGKPYYHYDDQEYTIDVDGTDLAEYAKEEGITPVYNNGDAKSADFTNTYDAKGEVQFNGTKTLENAELEEGQFEFSVSENGEKLQTVKNDADGNIAFKPIKYTLDDVGTHEYTVREESKDGHGITTDKTTYTVKVAVSDNGDGTLKVSKSKNADALDFVNVYEKKAKGEVTFSGTKTLENAELKDGQFEFSVSENGEKLQTVKNDADGNIAFKPIKYTLDDVGTHEYTVREETGDGNGIIADKTEYTVTVEVSDNGDGTLKTSKSDNADALDFVNVYEESGEIEIAFSGTKYMEGRELTDKDVFKFLIEENGEVIGTGSNDVDGNITFDTISFTADDVGQHVYKISEDKTDIKNVEIDDTVYTVIMDVTQKDDGTFEVIASGDDYQALDFTNTSKDKSAGTGDTFPLLYVMMLMALSGIVIILLLGRRRKA